MSVRNNKSSNNLQKFRQLAPWKQKDQDNIFFSYLEFLLSGQWLQLQGFAGAKPCCSLLPLKNTSICEDTFEKGRKTLVSQRSMDHVQDKLDMLNSYVKAVQNSFFRYYEVQQALGASNLSKLTRNREQHSMFSRLLLPIPRSLEARTEDQSVVVI